MAPFVGIALVWFIIEMLVWYLLSQFVSGWWVFLWFVVAAVIGISLIRKGIGVLNPMAQQMKTGGMLNPAMQSKEDTMIKTVAMSIAGILLLIPGLISDVLACLLMLPPVQKKLKNKANDYVMKNQEKVMEMMAKQMGGMGMGGQNPFGNMNDVNGQSPFGNMNSQNNPFSNKGSFGGFGNQNTTIDGVAKTVKEEAKTISPANDD